MNFWKNYKIFFLFALLFFAERITYCQQKETIRKKIDEIKEEIEYLNGLLEKRESEKKNYISTISLVERKINSQEKYVFALESEIGNLERIIKEYDGILKNLSEKLKGLKMSYGIALRNYYLKRDKVYFWVYLLAADNMVQSQRRFLYYRQYIKEMEYKAKSIQELLNEIGDKKKQAQILINDRINLMKLKESEIKKLEENKKQKIIILEKLKKEQGEIRKQITEKKSIAEKLEKEMKKIIEEEIKRSKGKNVISLTAEEKIIAGNFERNKGRLPWPVEKGVIIDKFGEHPHIVLKNVKVRNNGIDIETEKNSDVRSIYEGVVTKIVSILGAKFTIIIRHGNYLSVYQNIDDVLVKNGEKVKTGQKIGKVINMEGEDNPVIHLEIWKDFERMDPEEWIRIK
jgi:septal ring factor EnvC (AmiA/AmiB activator)